jgi:decaprenylphospho-beta-D-erythro-pentofuranosid-2-ulose 2-reductase
MKRYLVIGATSAIAQACCREWVRRKAGDNNADLLDFYLVGRTVEKLEQLGDDLRGRGGQTVTIHSVDLADTQAHAEMLQAAVAQLGAIDIVLIAHGTLPNQIACQADPAIALREFYINGSATIALLTSLGNMLEMQGHGVIAVITSVAGDRGRPSNYLYGSAKAAVSIFAEGLRARLFRSGVHVIDIRPGFVDTPMTQELDLPRLLVSTPDQVAKRIVSGIDQREDVVYVPGFWRMILWIIKHIPGSVFKRLSL